MLPVICGLICLTALAIDLSLPAIPLITRYYGVPEGDGQYVISIFVIGYAVGQLFWGAFSDMLGRRQVLLFGLVLFIIVGTLSGMARSFEELIVLRFVHGLSAGVGPVVGRAVVRDISSGDETVRLMALVTSILGLAPLFAPLIGSGIISIVEWEYTFHTVTLFAFILLLSVYFFVPETNVSTHGLPGFSWKFVDQLYQLAKEMVLNSRNVIPCLLVAVPFGGYYAILTGAPAVLNNVFGYDETLFGPLFAIIAIFWFIGATASRKLLNKYGVRKLKLVAVLFLLMAGALALGSVYYQLPFYIFWPMNALYIAGVGIIIPVATAAALQPFPDAAGGAAAILGLIQMGIGALSAMVVGILYNGTACSMVTVMFSLSVLSASLFIFEEAQRGIQDI
jgi:DHA1 family bicyclomycin/chloramphenicol resistance-like MFS transporter